MSRTLSSTLRQALYAQETDEVVACLITVTHADLDEPIRLSTDPTQRIDDGPPPIYGTISNGETYSFFPAEVVLAQDIADGDPEARLAIDNTELNLITALRSIVDAAEVGIQIVLASDPDTVEAEYPSLITARKILDVDIATLDRSQIAHPPKGLDHTKGYIGFAGHSDPVVFRSFRNVCG